MKKEIVAKRYGRNLVVMIDGKKITRVINTDKDKKDEESIKNKILLYNKKNSDSLKEQIMSLVDTTKVEKDKVIAEKKGIKKSIKKEVKKEKAIKKEINLIDILEKQELTEKDIDRLENLLNKTKDNQKKTEISPVVTSSPRRGEW